MNTDTTILKSALEAKTAAELRPQTLITGLIDLH